MSLKSETDPRITEIIAKLKNASYEAYVVGGAVRDIMLGRRPKDYDLATSATPEQVKKVFRDRRVLIIGRRFRLVHLYLGNDIIEISTFRKSPPRDIQKTDRPRRAADAPANMIFHDNEYGTAEDDAHRRDFTVNAVFYDPVDDRLLDYTGMGLSDLKSGTVRIIGDAELRFEEDPVRLLRALKLVGQYGFKFEEKTLAALRKTMPLIVHASLARLTLELEKILVSPYGHKILATFREYGFLKYFLPAFDEVYATPEGRYAMELLELRNTRILEGKYRQSLSIAYSILALPFAEKRLGGTGTGMLWDADKVDRDTAETVIRRTLLDVFAPHQITHRTSDFATRLLWLQPGLKNDPERRVSRPSPCSQNAIELAVIQNVLAWHVPDFEASFTVSGSVRDPLDTVPSSVSGYFRRRRPRRRHRKDRDRGNR